MNALKYFANARVYVFGGFFGLPIASIGIALSMGNDIETSLYICSAIEALFISHYTCWHVGRHGFTIKSENSMGKINEQDVFSVRRWDTTVDLSDGKTYISRQRREIKCHKDLKHTRYIWSTPESFGKTYNKFEYNAHIENYSGRSEVIIDMYENSASKRTAYLTFEPVISAGSTFDLVSETTSDIVIPMSLKEAEESRRYHKTHVPEPVAFLSYKFGASLEQFRLSVKFPKSYNARDFHVRVLKNDNIDEETTRFMNSILRIDYDNGSRVVSLSSSLVLGDRRYFLMWTPPEDYIFSQDEEEKPEFLEQYTENPSAPV